MTLSVLTFAESDLLSELDGMRAEARELHRRSDSLLTSAVTSPIMTHMATKRVAVTIRVTRAFKAQLKEQAGLATLQAWIVDVLEKEVARRQAEQRPGKEG